MELSARLADILADVMPVDVEADGALTVRHDGTVASLRTVSIADDIEMISLTQVWRGTCRLTPICASVSRRRPQTTMLGTVTLVEQTAKRGDVMLRYNFPGDGLGEAALRTWC